MGLVRIFGDFNARWRREIAPVYFKWTFDVDLATP